MHGGKQLVSDGSILAVVSWWSPGEQGIRIVCVCDRCDPLQISCGLHSKLQAMSRSSPICTAMDIHSVMETGLESHNPKLFTPQSKLKILGFSGLDKGCKFQQFRVASRRVLNVVQAGDCQLISQIRSAHTQAIQEPSSPLKQVWKLIRAVGLFRVACGDYGKHDKQVWQRL